MYIGGPFPKRFKSYQLLKLYQMRNLFLNLCSNNDQYYYYTDKLTDTGHMNDKKPSIGMAGELSACAPKPSPVPSLEVRA